MGLRSRLSRRRSGAGRGDAPSGPDTASSEPAPAPPHPVAVTGEWRQLAPLAPILPVARLTLAPAAFEAGLSTRRSPAFVRPLTHLVSRDGPAGTVGGLLSVARQPDPGRALSAPRSLVPTPLVYPAPSAPVAEAGPLEALEYEVPSPVPLQTLAGPGAPRPVTVAPPVPHPVLRLPVSSTPPDPTVRTPVLGVAGSPTAPRGQPAAPLPLAPPARTVTTDPEGGEGPPPEAVATSAAPPPPIVPVIQRSGEPAVPNTARSVASGQDGPADAGPPAPPPPSGAVGHGNDLPLQRRPASPANGPDSGTVTPLRWTSTPPAPAPAPGGAAPHLPEAPAIRAGVETPGPADLPSPPPTSGPATAPIGPTNLGSTAAEGRGPAAEAEVSRPVAGPPVERSVAPSPPVGSDAGGVGGSGLPLQRSVAPPPVGSGSDAGGVVGSGLPVQRSVAPPLVGSDAGGAGGSGLPVQRSSASPPGSGPAPDALSAGTAADPTPLPLATPQGGRPSQPESAPPAGVERPVLHPGLRPPLAERPLSPASGGSDATGPAPEAWSGPVQRETSTGLPLAMPAAETAPGEAVPTDLGAPPTPPPPAGPVPAGPVQAPTLGGRSTPAGLGPPLPAGAHRLPPPTPSAGAARPLQRLQRPPVPGPTDAPPGPGRPNGPGFVPSTADWTGQPAGPDPGYSALPPPAGPGRSTGTTDPEPLWSLPSPGSSAADVVQRQVGPPPPADVVGRQVGPPPPADVVERQVGPPPPAGAADVVGRQVGPPPPTGPADAVQRRAGLPLRTPPAPGAQEPEASSPPTVERLVGPGPPAPAGGTPTQSHPAPTASLPTTPPPPMTSTPVTAPAPGAFGSGLPLASRPAPAEPAHGGEGPAGPIVLQRRLGDRFGDPGVRIERPLLPSRPSPLDRGPLARAGWSTDGRTALRLRPSPSGEPPATPFHRLQAGEVSIPAQLRPEAGPIDPGGAWPALPASRPPGAAMAAMAVAGPHGGEPPVQAQWQPARPRVARGANALIGQAPRVSPPVMPGADDLALPSIPAANAVPDDSEVPPSDGPVASVVPEGPPASVVAPVSLPALAADPAPLTSHQLDLAADELYERVRSRLRAELRRDRERAGFLTDINH